MARGPEMPGHYAGTQLTDHFPSLDKLQVLLQLPILAWPQIRCMLRSLLISVISYYLNKPQRKPDSHPCERILLKMMMKRRECVTTHLGCRSGKARQTGLRTEKLAFWAKFTAAWLNRTLTAFSHLSSPSRKRLPLHGRNTSQNLPLPGPQARYSIRRWHFIFCS